MAYNYAALTEFLDGSTPSTGTVVLGSLFEAEFDQLYGNWQNFFGTTGIFSIDEIRSASGSEINFHEDSSDANVFRITNSTTTQAASHGIEVGIDADENGRIWNYENAHIIFGTNNLEFLRLHKDGRIVLSPGGSDNRVNILGGADLRIYSDDDQEYLTINHDGSNAILDTAGTSAGHIKIETNLGIGVIPTHPFHIQSSSAQIKIAYDSNSFWTFSVGSDSDLTLAAGEATGRINIDPGSSDTSVYFRNGTRVRLYSDDLLEYGQLQHDGSNLVITTGGTSAGDVVIDTCNLVVDDGYIQTGNAEYLQLSHDGSNGIITTGGTSAGDVVIDTCNLVVDDGYIQTGKGRWPTGSYLSGTSLTYGDVFTALSPYIPNNGDEIILNGSMYRLTSRLYVFSRAIRISSTEIDASAIYLDHSAGAAGGTVISFDSGASSTINAISITW